MSHASCLTSKPPCLYRHCCFRVFRASVFVRSTRGSAGFRVGFSRFRVVGGNKPGGLAETIRGGWAKPKTAAHRPPANRAVSTMLPPTVSWLKTAALRRPSASCPCWLRHSLAQLIAPSTMQGKLPRLKAFRFWHCEPQESGLWFARAKKGAKPSDLGVS